MFRFRYFAACQKFSMGARDNRGFLSDGSVSSSCVGAMSPLIRFLTIIGPCLATVVSCEMRPFLALRGGRVARTERNATDCNGKRTEVNGKRNVTEPNSSTLHVCALVIVTWLPVVPVASLCTGGTPHSAIGLAPVWSSPPPLPGPLWWLHQSGSCVRRNHSVGGRWRRGLPRSGPQTRIWWLVHPLL